MAQIINKIIVFTAVIILPVMLCAEEPMQELKTVEHVDISRYMGTWYEIARYTQSFEKGLVGVTATYKLLPNGKVDVLNSGHKGTVEGKLKTAHGKAIISDRQSNAKLKVTFFWPFYGNYWVIGLGKDYEYAVVGEPKRKYLWILSRTPRMDAGVYSSILERLKAQGYDVSRLDVVSQ